MKRVVIITSEGDCTVPIRALPPSTPGSKVSAILKRLESQNPGFRFHVASTRFGVPEPGEEIFKVLCPQDGKIRETRMPKSDKSESLPCSMAVFNGHVNDADKRARALMAKLHPNQLAEVEAIEKRHGGTMGIFQEPPTPATMFYAGLVTAYVNEDRT